MPASNPTPLEETITLVDEICRLNRFRYAVIGGIAATLYGSGRTTIDVDVIIQTELPDLEKVYLAFTKDFAPLKQDPLKFFKTFYVLPLVHKTLGSKLDVSAALSEFERRALDRGKRLHYGTASGVFCSPEDLILFKLVANRDRDLVDVRDIIRRNKNRLDRTYLRNAAKEFVDVERSDILRNVNEMLDER